MTKSDAFRTLDIQTIHLTTAINQSLTEGIIFQTPADHVVYKISEQGIAYQAKANWDSFVNWIPSPFQFVTKILTFLEYAIIGYLLYKVHVLTLAVAIVKPIAALAIKEANSSHIQQIEEFFRKQNEPTSSPVCFNTKPK
jgi:hypothetical protein